MRKAFNFYASYSDAISEMNDKQVATFITALLDVQFFKIHIKDVVFEDRELTFVWNIIKHSIESQIMGYCTKKSIDYDEMIPPSTPPLARGGSNKGKDKGKGKGKDKDNTVRDFQEKSYPENLNVEAFTMWCEYKGVNYKKQGKTLSINKLVKFDKDTQMKMVENSIMNGWKGLFEPKQQSTLKTKQPEKYSIGWQLQQEQNEIEGELI